MKYIFCVTITALFFVSSCKKYHAPAPEPLPPAAVDTTGSIDIVINNVVNDSALVLNSGKYTNANHDTFTVSVYKYYFTNIILKTASGYTWTQPESYYLVDQSVPGSLTVHVHGIPRASYSYIQFMIGVDAARNTAGAQTGALDPANGMFWSWNTGYIMARLEGTSPQSGAADKTLSYHIAGFSGVNSVIRKQSFNFPNVATVTKTQTPTITLKADVAAWFKAPNLISFALVYDVLVSGTNAKNIADNYSNMFSLTSVVN